jgi:tetratricopeptide (TPR) repeat protein
MARSQRNDNFVDQTFTVIADTILKLLPASRKEKEAFAYYRDGMAAQADGDYAEALENYTEALKLEENDNDRSYILYNMGLIYQSNGDYEKALDFYRQAIEINPRLPQALNNTAVIYHFLGDRENDLEKAEEYFNLAAEFWIRAIRLAPNNYIEAQNWLKTTGRADINAFF